MRERDGETERQREGGREERETDGGRETDRQAERRLSQSTASRAKNEIKHSPTSSTKWCFLATSGIEKRSDN